MVYLSIGIFIVVILAFPARFNFWRLPKKGIPILMYHMISEEKKGSKINKLRVSPEKFRKQMQYLKEKGYQSVSLLEIIDYHKTGKINVAKPVVITFDDGYKDNYTNAFPILKEFGFKGTFFIVTDFIDDDSLWNIEDKEKLMNWDEIKELFKEGMEIGSHSTTHPLLVNYPREKIFREIGDSKRVLENILGAEVYCFSYPYGKFDSESKMVVEKCGYKIACSTRMGKASSKDDIFGLRRILIRGDETIFDFYLQLTKGRNRL